MASKIKIYYSFLCKLSKEIKEDTKTEIKKENQVDGRGSLDQPMNSNINDFYTTKNRLKL